MSGHGEKLTRREEQAVAALLECPSVEAAAKQAGVSYSTLKRWLHDPSFAAAYRCARRELLDVAVGRIQAATGTAVDALMAVARDEAKDADRVRAAAALLEHAWRGAERADLLHGGVTGAGTGAGEREVDGTGDVVKILAERLRQVDAADLPTTEKARLTATLADALLRAIGVDVLDKRLEALQAVLIERKGKVQ
jgi:hypothetical protein